MHLQLKDRAKKLILEARKNINVSSSSSSTNYNNVNNTAKTPVSSATETSRFNLDKVCYNFYINNC